VHDELRVRTAVQLGARVQEHGTLVGAVTGLDSRQHRNRQTLREALEDRRPQIAAIAFGAAQEGAQNDGLQIAQYPGLAQLLEHPIEAVATLADVFQEQHAGGATLQRGTQ